MQGCRAEHTAPGKPHHTPHCQAAVGALALPQGGGGSPPAPSPRPPAPPTCCCILGLLLDTCKVWELLLVLVLLSVLPLGPAGPNVGSTPVTRVAARFVSLAICRSGVIVAGTGICAVAVVLAPRHSQARATEGLCSSWMACVRK